MLQPDETFFTSVGCMDGRVQGPILKLGKIKFGAKYPDTITEAGLVGLLSKDSIDEKLTNSLKKKLLISLGKHHSKGIVVHGHQECAASDAVDDERHRDDIRKSVEIIQSFVNFSVMVIGVFVKRSTSDSSIWEAEELSTKYTV